eukprot:scaffold1427_cov25-Prasinocladus_malaysianus.AAC.2
MFWAFLLHACIHAGFVHDDREVLRAREGPADGDCRLLPAGLPGAPGRHRHRPAAGTSHGAPPPPACLPYAAICNHRYAQLADPVSPWQSQ